MKEMGAKKRLMLNGKCCFFGKNFWMVKCHKLFFTQEWIEYKIRLQIFFSCVSFPTVSQRTSFFDVQVFMWFKKFEYSTFIIFESV